MQISFQKKTLWLLLLVGLLALIPVVALAHPMGDFAISRYSRLELNADSVDLFYVVDKAEVPTFQSESEIDTDGDGTFSAAEGEAYLSTIQQGLIDNLALTVDGTVADWTLTDAAISFPDGDGGLKTTRIELFLTTAAAVNDDTALSYVDSNFEERIGWKEVVIQANDGVAVTASTAPTEDLSNELRDYPEEMLLDNSSAEFNVALCGAGCTLESVVVPAVGGTGEGDTTIEGGGGRFDEQFANLLNLDFSRPSVILTAIGISLIAGAFHALAPGHGKTIVAAYLVGTRGTPKHAIFLGITTTITHTLGVFGIGLITLFASRYILPEDLYPWIQVFSGLLVVGIGYTLFRSRFSGAVNPGINLADHEHGDVDFSDGMVHSHGGGAAHSHLPPTTEGGVTWGNLLALGVSGGLIPCPAALVLMLAAISFQQVALGLALIFVFSVGLATVLTLIGLMFVKARDVLDRLTGENSLSERNSLLGRALAWGPAISAAFITMAGLIITFQALRQTGLI